MFVDYKPTDKGDEHNAEGFIVSRYGRTVLIMIFFLLKVLLSLQRGQFLIETICAVKKELLGYAVVGGV